MQVFAVAIAWLEFEWANFNSMHMPKQLVQNIAKYNLNQYHAMSPSIISNGMYNK